MRLAHSQRHEFEGLELNVELTIENESAFVCIEIYAPKYAVSLTSYPNIVFRLSIITKIALVKFTVKNTPIF